MKVFAVKLMQRVALRGTVAPAPARAATGAEQRVWPDLRQPRMRLEPHASSPSTRLR